MKLPIEDQGMPLGIIAKKYLNKQKNNKFIYPDSWGDVVLRSEAWILIKNLIHIIKQDEFELNILNDIIRQQEKVCKFEEYDLCCSDMERFWEKVIKECKKYIKERK